MSTSHTRSTRFSRWLGMISPVLVVAVCAAPAFGQPAADTGNNQQTQRGNFDPARFKQMMIDRMKEALGATDEEMQALTPKLEKVFQLQRDASSGGMRMFSRRDQNAQPSDQPLSNVQQKAKDLKAAIDANAPSADIKAKMQALREARVAAKQDLGKAQSELKELLSVKQEATLLMMGMLE